MDNYADKVQEVIDIMAKDYLRMGTSNERTYFVEEGRMYDRIVSTLPSGQMSCAGFICRKDNPKKGFVRGDMLMPASWKAPATNFARGNIFTNMPARISWTGIS